MYANSRTENDQLFPDHIRTEGQQYLEEHKTEHQIQVYPGVPHGRYRNLLVDTRLWPISDTDTFRRLRRVGGI